MLAEHVVDIDIRGYRAVQLKMSNGDRRGARYVVDEPQFAGPDRKHGVANPGIVSDASLKFEGIGRLLDLAHQIKISGRVGAVSLGRSGSLNADIGDDADKE